MREVKSKLWKIVDREEETQQKEGIIPIDYELIRTLKFQKRFTEAWELITAHQNSLLKNKNQEKKELKGQEAKIRRQKLLHQNRCVYCRHSLPFERQHRTYCNVCQKSYRL